MKRHRVFSTSVSVQPREIKRKSVAGKKNRRRRSKRDGGEDMGEDVSSWIASEIFSIAKTQAAEMDLVRVKPGTEGIDKAEIEKGEVVVEVVEMEVGVGDYDEIESLMGEYFEDVKVVGSDCGND